jgi:hypothetical protein
MCKCFTSFTYLPYTIKVYIFSMLVIQKDIIYNSLTVFTQKLFNMKECICQGI